VGAHKDTECIICLDAKVQVMLLPCKCFKVCVACSDDLKARGKGDTCPWCQSPVNMHLKVHRT
jgi:hypothetical protein